MRCLACRWRRAAAGAALLAGASLLAPPPAVAQRQALKPRLSPAQIAEALRQGGYSVLWRHTATDPFAGDPELFDLADCSTQRNLSEQGRRQARLVGRAFEKLGIRVSKVLSSPYCRCVDTGELAFGRVEKSDLLSVGDDLSMAQKDERGAKIRAMLASAPPDRANAVLITHTGTLLYSFGLQVRPERVRAGGLCGHGAAVGVGGDRRDRARNPRWGGRRLSGAPLPEPAAARVG